MANCGRVDRSRVTVVAATLCLLLVTDGARADSVYVSPDGRDVWSGQLAKPNAARTDGPVRTLQRAAGLTGSGDTCYLREGVYEETLRPAASGEAGKPITFTNYEGEKAVLSGATSVTGWQKGDGGTWSAAVAWDLEGGNQVFADGKPLTEARWPNNAGMLLRPVRARAESGSAGTLVDPALPGGPDAWKGALLWCAGGHEWICWTARATHYDAKTHTLTFEKKQARKFYTPRRNNPYVLMGVRRALDADGEWWFDSTAGRLHLQCPAARPPTDMRVEMKRRLHAIDLSGRSHVHIVGLHFRAAGIRTDSGSADIVLDGLRGKYVGHSYEEDISSRQGVLIHGKRIVLRNSELAYSSGSVVDVRGSDNRIINCHIHDGNYGAKWRGTLGLTGRRHVVAYNTVRHSGRDLVNIYGLTESLLERNDLSDAGWLTSDLGMTYGHNTDFGNTEIRYNLVHDNHAPSCNMGIYFDHLSHNVIVHHNIVWNVRGDPIRVNNPSYYALVYHNTCWQTGRITTFDHARRNDLFGTRYANNILNDLIRLPDHVAVVHNVIDKTPPLANPGKRDFRLEAGAKAIDAGEIIEGMTATVTDGRPDIGALERGRKLWRCGHDFANPPAGPFQWTPPRIGYMNVLANPCFEREQLESWKKTGAGKAALTRGNFWGVASFSGVKKTQGTGTSKRELRLGGGVDGIEQTVRGLSPNTQYTLAGWLRVSVAAESVALGVRDYGGRDLSAATSSTEWVRKTITFKTGPKATGCTVSISKTTAGPGHAWADNLGLPLTPAGM